MSESELLRLHREALDKALRVLHRVLGEDVDEEVETLRALKGLTLGEIREAADVYRRSQEAQQEPEGDRDV